MHTSVVFALAFTCLATTGCDSEMSVAEKVQTDAPTPTRSVDASTSNEGTNSSSSTDSPPEPSSTSTQSNALAADNSESSSTEGEDEETLRGDVNLNSASTDELDMLPGVGPAIASRIVEYRNKRQFEKPRHLKRVKGIGPVTFSEMKPYVTTQGDTTIHQE